MTKKKFKTEKNDDIRSLAEKLISPDVLSVDERSHADVCKLAYELQVHQIELEMQNDELRKSQQELEDSRDEYSNLYDFAPVGYITLSGKGIILKVNLTCTKLLGLERSSLIEKPLSRYIARENHDDYYQLFNRNLQIDEHEVCELKMVRSDGSEFYAHLECVLVLAKNENEKEIRITITDITARKLVSLEIKALNASLEQRVVERTAEVVESNKALQKEIVDRKKMEETLLLSEKIKSLGVITTGVAHEFNNILAVIMGTAELLGSGFEDEQDLKNGLNDIVQTGVKGAGIVRNMLSYAKSHDNDISDFILFDISYILEEAINFTRHRWESMALANWIDYQIDREDMREIPEVLCSHTELLDVFINIINNALDAMPYGGRLSFSTSSNDDTVFIRISDTGIGMSEDVKKSIFDPFFTTRRPQGTGLGMSISYGTMTRHGGKIEVESEKGKGATFNLSIPIRKEVVQKEVPLEYERRVTRRKLQILVIDDNEDVCEIVDAVLTRGGHAVTSVDNGAEAIILAGKKDCDLVMCDLLLPEVSGHEVVSVVNRMEQKPKIGVMTGWSEDVDLTKDGKVKLNVDFIIKKPFKFPDLARHVNALFA